MNLSLTAVSCCSCEKFQVVTPGKFGQGYLHKASGSGKGNLKQGFNFSTCGGVRDTSSAANHKFSFCLNWILCLLFPSLVQNLNTDKDWSVIPSLFRRWSYFCFHWCHWFINIILMLCGSCNISDFKGTTLLQLDSVSDGVLCGGANLLKNWVVNHKHPGPSVWVITLHKEERTPPKTKKDVPRSWVTPVFVCRWDSTADQKSF